MEGEPSPCPGKLRMQAVVPCAPTLHAPPPLLPRVHCACIATCLQYNEDKIQILEPGLDILHEGLGRHASRDVAPRQPAGRTVHTAEPPAGGARGLAQILSFLSCPFSKCFDKAIEKIPIDQKSHGIASILVVLISFGRL